MINANEEWAEWVAKNWPNATPYQQSLLWALWCTAWTRGRIQERMLSEESGTAGEP